MQKQAPSFGRILVMVLFALSCFGLLLFLWLSFGGSIPLKPRGYRVQVAFPEATQLAQEADVRVAGVSVGKVISKARDPQGNRTVATIELDRRFAPLHRDAQAILRQKTLLGETYVELTPGAPHTPFVPDGGWLSRGNVHKTVELDEIFQALDPQTRRAFQGWQQELAKAVRGNDRNLSDAIGNLPHFAADTNDVVTVLDVQRAAVRSVIHNTGTVFNALTQNEAQLRNLITGSDRTFSQTAAHEQDIADTFRIFPTFLDESRSTLARLQTFAHDTDPLIRDLRPVARDLRPTLRDVRAFAPDLRRVFVNLGPLIDVSQRGLPALTRTLRGAKPLLAQLGPFLEQLNPILQYLEQNQHLVSDFLTYGEGGLASKTASASGGVGHYLRQFGPMGPDSLAFYRDRPPFNRGNAYLPPLALQGPNLGKNLIFPNWDCVPTGGPKPATEGPSGSPACFVGSKLGFKGQSGMFPQVTQDKYKAGR